MDGNTEKTKRTPRGTVYLCDDEAYNEILEFIRHRAYLVYSHSASTPSHRLIVKEEGF